MAQEQNLVPMVMSLQQAQADLNAAMMTVQATVGRIEGATIANQQAVIQRLDSINGTIDDHEDTLANHGSRISKVEATGQTLKIISGGALSITLILVTALGVTATVYLK